MLIKNHLIVMLDSTIFKNFILKQITIVYYFSLKFAKLRNEDKSRADFEEFRFQDLSSYSFLLKEIINHFKQSKEFQRISKHLRKQKKV